MVDEGMKKARVQVVAAVATRDGKVLMVRTSKHGAGLPAGKVQPGETHVDALVREVEEETGLAVLAVGDPLGTEVAPGYECHHYEVEVDQGAPRAGSDAQEAWWATPDEARLPAFPMVHPMVLAQLARDAAPSEADEGWAERLGRPSAPAPTRQPGEAVRWLSDAIQTLFGFLKHAGVCGIIPCDCGMAHARSRAAALRTVMVDDLQVAAAVSAATERMGQQLAEELARSARLRRVIEDPAMAASSVPGEVLRAYLEARGWRSLLGTGEAVRMNTVDRYTGPAGGLLWLWPEAPMNHGTAAVVARFEGRPVEFLLADLMEASEAAVPPPESGRLRSTRELVAWLTHAALEAGGLSEGEVARAMGLDRVEVRGVAIEGRDVGDRLRQERMARVRAECAHVAPSSESGPPVGPVRGESE